MSSLTHAPRHAHVSPLWRAECSVCELPAAEAYSEAEANLLAALHDRLHHRGKPVMRVRGAYSCPTCSGAATRVVVVAEGVAPVALCSRCAELVVEAHRPMAVAA